MSQLTVSRELHPENQEKIDPIAVCNRIVAQSYASITGVDMIEVRRINDMTRIWRSEDNGRTWALTEEMPYRGEACGEGKSICRYVARLYLDPVEDILVRFLTTSVAADSYFDCGVQYNEKIKGFFPNTYRAFYQISRDGGRSWTPEKQWVQRGAAYDADHWAENTHFAKSSLRFEEVPPYPKLPDGAILIPYQGRSEEPDATYGTIQAGCVLARWTDDRSDLEWDTAGRVPGGGCEQTLAILKDGRILNVLRAQGIVRPYFFPPRRRPYALSEDGGRTWAEPRPLTFDDGSLFTSSASWSRLIRSSKNGRLYWIATMRPGPDDPAELADDGPRADPRHPLQIAEVDEDTLTIRKDTVTVIEDRDPTETDWVRFSNFRVYEDRETQEIVVLMMKAYCEKAEDVFNLPTPSYRYRIAVPE